MTRLIAVFLLAVISGLNFSDRYFGWIWECVSTPTYSIEMNSEVRGFFPGMQGLRQGDPLSPYLFILCIEYLSRLLKVRIDNTGFKFLPKCRLHQITHLAFADDLMVLARGVLPLFRSCSIYWRSLEKPRVYGLVD